MPMPRRVLRTPDKIDAPQRHSAGKILGVVSVLSVSLWPILLRALNTIICVGLLGLIGCMALAGCGAIGWAAHAAGEGPVAAQYVPAQRPMVVFVQGQPDPAGQTFQPEQLAMAIEPELMDHHIAPLVPSVKLAEMRTAHPAEFAALSPAAAGKAVGAAQVLLVRIISSGIGAGPGNDMLKGQIAATVSIIDADTGDQLWPTDGTAGTMMSYATPALRVTDQNTADGVQNNITAGLADQIAKLFYTYKPE